MTKVEVTEVSEKVKEINTNIRLGKYNMSIITEDGCQKVKITYATKKFLKVVYTGTSCFEDDWTENMVKLGIIADTLNGIVEKRSMELAKNLGCLMRLVKVAGDRMYAKLTQDEKTRYLAEYPEY